jgi:hypothetical protein
MFFAGSFPTFLFIGYKKGPVRGNELGLIVEWRGVTFVYY